MPRGTTPFNVAVSADEVAPVLLVRILNLPHKTDGTLDFDGVNDYVEVPRVIQDDWTIEFWVNTTDVGLGTSWYLGKGLVDGEVGGVANDFGTSVDSQGRFTFGVGNPDTHLHGSVINDGNWHHCAATRIASTGEMKVYTDGVLDNSVIGPTGTKNAPPSLRIGMLQTGIHPGINPLNGFITEVRIWNVARTQAEIQADMNRTLAGDEPGLVAYYSMRVPPTGNILPDLSPNNNDGTIYGATYVPITESLYLTDYQEKDVKTIDFFDENWNPCQYVCCNVKYDSIEVGADNTVNEVNITIDNVDRTFSALAQYYRLYGVEVHALTAERSVLNIPEGAVMRFAGKLKEARINEHAIILRVTSGYTLSCLIPKLMYDSKHFPYIPSAKDPRQVP